MTLDNTVAPITLDSIFDFDTIGAFVTPVSVLLTSQLVMWLKEQLW
jgi:hypothetical protein